MFDLQINAELYDKNIAKLLLSKKNFSSSNDDAIVKDYFVRFAISDKQRKILWKNCIGNKLKMNKEIFSNLMIKLGKEVFPDSIEKLIRYDMMRSFPKFNTQMSDDDDTFKNLTLLLKLFHIYRPEVGYTQGMAYHMSLLYTYYSEYETFKYFCNLIYTKEFIFQFYKFNMKKVIFFI